VLGSRIIVADQSTSFRRIVFTGPLPRAPGRRAKGTAILMSMKILVVEDEALLRDGLVDLLEGAGHEVCAVGDGTAAVESALAEPFELILLDLMLPGIDGMEVCRRIKKARPAQNVLILTARGAEDDKVKGLDVGADDYVTKPFGARELLARVGAIGRRAESTPASAEELTAFGCVMHLGRCEVERDGQAIALTAREVGILRWLHRHRNRAVSRAELLEHIWGARGDLQTRTVDMTIAKLRQKIERDPANPRIILTVTGVGYAWGNG